MQGFPQTQYIRGGVNVVNTSCNIKQVHKNDYIKILLFLSDDHLVTALEKSNCDISGPLDDDEAGPLSLDDGKESSCARLGDLAKKSVIF